MASNGRAGSIPALGTNWNLKCFVVTGCLIIIVSNVKPQNTKAMKIPVSTPSRTDVVVDVIKLENGKYSATCAEVVNGFGLVPLNNYEVFNEANEEKMYVPTCMFNPKIGEYRMPTFVRKTFEDALNNCLDFLYLADGLVRH